MTPETILAVLRATSAPDLPPPQGIRILCAIYDAPKTKEEIAEMTNIARGSLATITVDLKQAGLLEIDDDYRRVITQEGRDIVEALTDCLP